MKYREQLIALLFDSDTDALMNWIQEQPLLDQPEIFRELKLVITELDESKEETNTALIAAYDAAVDRYEDKILDDKLAEVIDPELLGHHDEINLESNEDTAIRKYIINCILTNAPNAAEMRELAEKMMEFEKQMGLFNPDDWKEIL